jgi:hypothetical protein
MTIDANHLRLGTGLSVDGTDLIKTPTKGARVRRSTAQSIPNASFSTALIFDQELTDDGGMFDVGQPTRLTAPADGWYSLVATLNYAANATGTRYVWFRINGVDIIDSVNSDAASAGPTILNLSTQTYLSADDYVEIIAYQDSGAALNVEAADNSPLFIMVQL